MSHKINWGSVKPARDHLKVQLAGNVQPDAHWKHYFEAASRGRLPGVQYSIAPRWGRITLEGSVIKIEQVAEGGTDELGPYLNALVDQTNKDYAVHAEEVRRQMQAHRDEEQRRAQETADLARRLADAGLRDQAAGEAEAA